MSNIAQWLTEAEASSGERIESICVGLHDCDKSENLRNASRLNRLLTRDEGLAVLDVEYDSSFGGTECFPMYAWSLSWVYFIHEYDGATNLNKLPRTPCDCKPEFNGFWGF